MKDYRLLENYFIAYKFIDFCEHLINDFSHDEIGIFLNYLEGKYINSMFFYRNSEYVFFIPGGVLGVVPLTKILTNGLLQNASNDKKILDVGCGCGYSSVITANLIGNSCLCVDINYLSVLTTKINAIWNGVADKLSVIHADFALLDTSEQYDIMICNPAINVSDKHNSIKSYESLLNKSSAPHDMRHANNEVTDLHNISIVDRMFMSQLLAHNGSIIIGSGNLRNIQDGIIKEIAKKYSFNLKKEHSTFCAYANFTDKDGTCIFDYKYLIYQIKSGHEIFTSDGVLIKASELPAYGDIYFKGFWHVYERSHN